ncbi:MAG TPA: hypothetical protein PKU95_04030 [Candidatus Dojkabacteria bacterium]|nr:hypothetical protein [Candidatus Dojkabacteria bacterium]
MSPERKSPFIFRFLKEGLKLSLFGLAGAILGTGLGYVGALLGSSFFASTLTSGIFAQAPIATAVGGTAGILTAATSNSN